MSNSMQLLRVLLHFCCVWTCLGQPDWNKIFNKTKASIPPFQENTLDISVVLTIVSITSIVESKLEFDADLQIALKWSDNRINEPNYWSNEEDTQILPSNILPRLWRPKMFIGSDRQGNRKNLYVKDGQERKDEPLLSYFLTQKNLEMRTNPNVKIFCPFQFYNYPFDVQHCVIRLQFDVTTPKGVQAVFDESVKPLLLDESPSLQLDIAKVTRGYCLLDQSIGSLNFSCLELRITFQRRLSTFITQIFIPSTMIVVLSWFSFWLDVESAPARISLGVTALLTLSTNFAQNNRGLPAVAYMKAIDLWMFFCIFYVFMTLVEFTVAYTINRKAKAKINKDAILHKQIAIFPGRRFIFRETRAKGKTDSTIKIFIKKVRKIKCTLDDIARIVFPTCFIVFALSFMFYYVREMQLQLHD